MHYIVLYPRNGDRIVTIDSVTSLYPMYTNAFLLHCPLTRNWKWPTPRTATLLMAWRDLRLPSKVPQNPISRERHHIHHTGWGCNSAAAAARRSILSLASSWRSRPTRGLLLSCAAGAVDCHTHVRPSRCHDVIRGATMPASRHASRILLTAPDRSTTGMAYLSRLSNINAIMIN